MKLAEYEGLVMRTAQIYAPFVDEDEDDIRQELRIKVWKALDSYKPERATQPVNEYVFSCVRNRVKDLLKKKRRPEDFIEDVLPPNSAPARERFEARYLQVDEGAVVEAKLDDCPLPSTLSRMEIEVVLLLVADYNQTEIARKLGVSRSRVRAAHASVRVKMADWGGAAVRESPAIPLAA